jgi:hypothetical protein
MLLALASIFFIAFMAFIAIAPEDAIQIFLALSWLGMLLASVYTLLSGLMS